MIASSRRVELGFNRSPQKRSTYVLSRMYWSDAMFRTCKTQQRSQKFRFGGLSEWLFGTTIWYLHNSRKNQTLEVSEWFQAFESTLDTPEVFSHYPTDYFPGNWNESAPLQLLGRAFASAFCYWVTKPNKAILEKTRGAVKMAMKFSWARAVDGSWLTDHVVRTVSHEVFAHRNSRSKSYAAPNDEDLSGVYNDTYGIICMVSYDGIIWYI